ncbi:MAG: hypothetical protein E6K79_02625 [Candidatus Eisenbacteria bacterium]|uniref:ParB/Sulfiredoxin domain-containing protein n=1 Tax=Eiseniibacteriota bacterium TaxID=2212470 RepID=A0A538TRK5_UNCEI|nr:MAG: hypothetical protein E6K79_02625 [Candidatus Eisenbacteria bacterium]
MPHADPSGFRLPDLRFAAVDLLVPHEKEDQRRTESLAARLRESGILRNPPIVTPARSDQRFVVLDGANRVSTIRAAGFPHVVVQVVPYEGPGVRLSTWHHALGKVAAEELERALPSIPGLESHREDLSHARALLARREAIAFVERADGAVICLHGGPDLHARNALLNAVVDLYRGKHPYHRVTRDSIEEARGRHPDAAALVVFPQFHPEEILEVALGGARLPAGITRHVIAWRALRINMPLDVMADPSRKLPEKQRWLSEWLAERVEQSAVRFYEESTVLFDE